MIFQKAEGRGFSVEEVQLATDFPKMQTRNILDWLFEVWPDIQSEAIKVFAEEKMGVLSTDEARDALVACGGDIQKAVRLCAQERQAKVISSGYAQSVSFYIFDDQNYILILK